jgi:YVTN family beta-propeller protein
VNINRLSGIRTARLSATVLPALLLGSCGVPSVSAAPALESPTAAGHPGFLSPHANPIAASGGLVFVANTPADTLDVIDATTRQIVKRISVGLQPVSVAVRPDGQEVWVSNHVSDSVSVIDVAPESPTRFVVVATIQDFDPLTKATRFDEPVGIAFAETDDTATKAYVALSSENQIAIIDVASRSVTGRLQIPAQDPRAIAVRNGRLYVAAFESHNQTQLSGGRGDKIDGDLVTFDAWHHSIFNNNVLSIGHAIDIVKHPDVPDRDLFVFDTADDSLVETVTGLGTLLYGLAVDDAGRVFLAQTDARNEINGRAGTKGHTLAELDNRPFLNRITSVRPESGDAPTFFDLEPLPPEQPAEGEALATPFGLAVSDDGGVLVATAASSDALFTVATDSGTVLGRVPVGSWPTGIALEPSAGDDIARGWVLNAFEASVSLVDLSDPAQPVVLETIPLDDPTPDVIAQGRRAFHTASASSTGTFSCASCHPDGHTDQLLWVLKTPVVSGGEQIMPRSTMPCRGLRDTAPFHWDGIPGDPYGGINSASVHAAVDANSDPTKPESSVRHLIDGGLASTMLHADDKSLNDEGKAGHLSAADRDAMAAFLLDVPYPPAPRRPYTNVVSERARQGMKLFHVDGDNDPGKPRPNVCGDCHRLPHLVSTNTPGTGMDAPTWRGAYDRWLILPQGRLNIVDFPFFKRVADQGTPEEEVWRFSWGGRERFNPVWDMVLEASTGFVGGFGRQATLNTATARDPQTLDLLTSLEQADRDGSVVLTGEGLWLDADGPTPVCFTVVGDRSDSLATYQVTTGSGRTFSATDLAAAAADGRLLVTFTARACSSVNAASPQPAIWTSGPLEQQRGRQRFPRLAAGETRMTASGRHVRPDAVPLVDGHKAAGTVAVSGDQLTVDLVEPPAVGMHLLQLQNPDGLASNDFLFFVRAKAEDDDEPADRESLAGILKAAGWEGIVGTWVDKATKGTIAKTTYRWSLPGRVLEVRNEGGETPSVALIGVNPTNGDVFHVGGDSKGSSFLGTWNIDDGGIATLSLQIAGAEGNEFTLQIRHELLDADTIRITIQLPQPIVIDLVRVKE